MGPRREPRVVKPTEPEVGQENVEESEPGTVPEGEVFDPNKGPDVADPYEVNTPPPDIGEDVSEGAVGGAETAEQRQAAGIDVQTEDDLADADEAKATGSGTVAHG